MLLVTRTKNYHPLSPTDNPANLKVSSAYFI